MSGRSGRTVEAQERVRCGAAISRRRWLEVIAVAFPGTMTAAWAQAPKKAPLTAEEEKVVAAVRDTAKKTGLGAFDVRWTDHFLGVGDGAAGYSMQALNLSESIARDFLARFRKRGFKVDFPARRMTVVTLKNAASYHAFSGEETDETVGGHYDQDGNWLVIFDFRPEKANVNAKRTNTFTLVHENIHLLCFNTGLLPPKTDAPAAISEGLATYGELWTPPGTPSAFGAVNQPRLRALLQQNGEEISWIPVDRLLADDEWFNKPETTQLAYAEAWLLVHFLMDTEERLPRFRAYLAGMPEPGKGAALTREKHAETELGSLRDLDLAVRRHAQRIGRRAGLRLPAGFSQGRD
jgi:Protein of unknown function (DUF1570)